MRPDPRIPAVAATFLEEDSNGWLVTFSDLVLQLFAFVMVAAVLGTGAVAGSARAVMHPRTRMQVASSDAEVARVDRPAVDALSRARFDPPPVPAPLEHPIAAEPPPPTRPTVRAAVVVDLAPAAPQPAVAPQPLPERSLAHELESFVASEGLEDVVQVAVAGGGVTLSISDTIGFASGSAELLPDAGPVLAEVRSLVTARPDLVVEVSGHTDDRPPHAGAFRSNLDLSLARAARVAHELAADDAELTGRIFAAGYGAARPAAANDDAEGRARNRRVELRLVPAHS